MFKRATGVLGWTPEVAWSAHVAEIEAAHEGRFEMIDALLRSIFGDSKKDGDPDLFAGGQKPDRKTVAAKLQAIFGGRRKR